ncbi:ankyrin repeat-containing protein [Hibiscus syriacus]|uniref:Ankyrin repeat-containing protein n=1 Tax=Hibiscus syriacus TaxID=106335 RepID=A0A6A2YTF7_HIBSY|nr:protein BIG GRAIN 1-like A [Hibiscus syriacus]KAE8682617.1 ankyrin repeat-containing protein [Hibiscus syriacus]
MYRLEKTVYKQERYNPSFSSTLLDKIYRSIDDGDTTNGDLKFYTETIQKKQIKGTTKCNKSRGYGEEEDEEMSSLRQACLIEKWVENKVNEKANGDRKQLFSDFLRKSHHEYGHDRDHDHDVVFFSSTSTSTSTSTSSDSSSGGFSASDTESMHVTKSKSSCFVTSKLKPIRTRESIRSEKSVKTEKTGLHMLDDYHYSSASDYTPKLHESLFSSKSTKIYSNLKKVKHSISPGGRLASFIYSLFTTSNTKKARGTPSSIVSCDDERKLKSGKVSTCSSASSFSRSCLSKNSPSTRERLRNGVKRNVRFCPVSVIVDEDCRPCGQKCIYEEEDSSSSVPVAVWKIRKSPSRKVKEEIKFQVMEKARRVEEMAAKFLKEHHLNQRKNDYISRGNRSNYVTVEMDEDQDDAASYSSSDLFELDHLVVIGNKKYREELPVYETTHVETNRAIANGLIA